MLYFGEGRGGGFTFLPSNFDSAPKTPPFPKQDLLPYMWGWCRQLSLTHFQAPCSLRSFMERSEYRSLPLQMDASRQKSSGSTSQLKCCITVYLRALFLGDPLSCELTPPIWEFMVGVGARGWDSQTSAQVVGNAKVSSCALVGNLFLLVAPSCEWERAQPFLLTCKGWSSDEFSTHQES